MGSKILYNQKSIYDAICKLFRAPTVRRVAISAFVGNGAESYLPNPKGIELICWPKAGGTNPAALRELMKRHVDVWFADRVHMKVYWAENRGCVITSANLSTNALGSGRLKEAGILIPSDEIDIDSLLVSLNKRRASETELKKLDQDHARFFSQNEFEMESATPTFKEWLATPMRPAWKLGWSDSEGDACIAAKEIARDETGIAKPVTFLDARESDYERSDWILAFNLAKDFPTDAGWIFSHHVVKVSPREKCFNREYPWQVVQVWPLDRCPGCPFVFDHAFRMAFRAAVREYGPAKIQKAKRMEPSSDLIDLISKHI